MKPNMTPISWPTEGGGTKLDLSSSDMMAGLYNDCSRVDGTTVENQESYTVLAFRDKRSGEVVRGERAGCVRVKQDSGSELRMTACQVS